jgi:hypothetical protein
MRRFNVNQNPSNSRLFESCWKIFYRRHRASCSLGVVITQLPHGLARAGRRDATWSIATVADDAAKVQKIRAARAGGKSIRTIAREQGVGIGTVSRLTG